MVRKRTTIQQNNILQDNLIFQLQNLPKKRLKFIGAPNQVMIYLTNTEHSVILTNFTLIGERPNKS